jgi:thiamine-phosphate pyrophosphorylase
MQMSKLPARESKAKRFQYCLITDHSLYKQPLHEVAEHAEEARVDYFQLREKNLEAADLLPLAFHIRAMLFRTKFIINGHLDVALAANADGVHLQKDNLPVSEVRKRFPHLLIGYSAHTAEELKAAEDAGADYAFLSPVFVGGSKVSSLEPLGISRFMECTRDRKIPVFALGGIARESVPALAASGCAGMAGISFFVEKGYFDPKGMVIQ